MNRLRNLMQHASDLTQPMNYFLRRVATDPVFMQQSVPGEPDLDIVVQAVVHYVLGLEAPLIVQRFFRNGLLWHGCCFFGASPATVLYHDGIEIGLLAIPYDDQHATVRFTRVVYGSLDAAEPLAN